MSNLKNERKYIFPFPCRYPTLILQDPTAIISFSFQGTTASLLIWVPWSRGALRRSWDLHSFLLPRGAALNLACKMSTPTHTMLSLSSHQASQLLRLAFTSHIPGPASCSLALFWLFWCTRQVAHKDSFCEAEWPLQGCSWGKHTQPLLTRKLKQGKRKQSKVLFQQHKQGGRVV